MEIHAKNLVIAQVLGIADFALITLANTDALLQMRLLLKMANKHAAANVVDLKIAQLLETADFALTVLANTDASSLNSLNEPDLENPYPI